MSQPTSTPPTPEQKQFIIEWCIVLLKAMVSAGKLSAGELYGVVFQKLEFHSFEAIVQLLEKMGYITIDRSHGFHIIRPTAKATDSSGLSNEFDEMVKTS